MTAVKEQLVQMVPQMPMLIPNLTEEKAKLIYNTFITVEPERLNHGGNDDFVVPSVEKRQKALARLMKHKGSVHLPEDRDAAKEEYLRSKYESLD